MEIKTFWRIVIKGIGLWFLINILQIIPQLIANLSYIENHNDWGNLTSVLAINLLVFIIYVILIRLFLFQSDWLINILRLDQNFSQEKIGLTMPAETVMRIIIVVSGALIFVEALPNLIKGIFQFIQQTELIKDYPETSWLLFDFLKTLFGYLIMTNSRAIEKFIHKESRNNGKQGN